MLGLLEEVNGKLDLAANRMANPNLSCELFEGVSNRSNEWLGAGARQASCRLFLLADHQMDLLLEQDVAHRSIAGARARRGQLGCPQGKPVDSRLRRYPS